jgi:hypothetical protein
MIACRSPDTPVIKSLMPYTNKAIPITTPASCTPNVGEAIIETDKATASPPAATLSAREALPGIRRFPMRLTLRPDMMLATPLTRSARAANHTTKVALAIGYAMTILGKPLSATRQKNLSEKVFDVVSLQQCNYTYQN